MIRFFIQVVIVFVCVVLSIKWTVEAILFREVYSDRNRVIAGLSQVHLDQLHFLADQLVACPPQEQGATAQDWRTPQQLIGATEDICCFRARLLGNGRPSVFKRRSFAPPSRRP